MLDRQSAINSYFPLVFLHDFVIESISLAATPFRAIKILSEMWALQETFNVSIWQWNTIKITCPTGRVHCGLRECQNQIRSWMNQRNNFSLVNELGYTRVSKILYCLESIFRLSIVLIGLSIVLRSRAKKVFNMQCSFHTNESLRSDLVPSYSCILHFHVHMCKELLNKVYML